MKRVALFLLATVSACASSDPGSSSGGETCMEGFSPCPPASVYETDAGTVEYEPVCVNNQSDGQNCGGCGIRCEDHTLCVDGTCGCGTASTRCTTNDSVNECCAGLHCVGIPNMGIAGRCQ